MVGSVSKGGNKVRINAKLIDAEKDTQIWSQNWDRSLEDIFESGGWVSGSRAILSYPRREHVDRERVIGSLAELSEPD